MLKNYFSALHRTASGMNTMMAVDFAIVRVMCSAASYSTKALLIICAGFRIAVVQLWLALSVGQPLVLLPMGKTGDLWIVIKSSDAY